MKVLLASAALAILVLAAACSSDNDDAAPSTAAPGPNIEATVQAGVQATVSAMPQATAIPETLSADTLSAAAQDISELSADWDALRADIDAWRSGLINCDASAVHGALLGFTGTTAALADEARNLPGDQSAGELADLVIQAIEGEATAFRALRDTWTPDGITPFETVEDARSVAADLRRQSDTRFAELSGSSSSASRSEVASFKQANDALDLNWELFINDYEDFRQREPLLDPVTIVTDIGALVIQTSNILAQVRALPTTEEARPVVLLLAQAAEETDLALRQLRDALRPDEFGLTPITTGFVEFETVLVASSGLRLAASQTLADVTDQASSATASSLQDFGAAFDPLAVKWDAFHTEFDAWRASEGGCDRISVVTRLGTFANSYGEITAGVRALPRALTLREPIDLLLEAIEREELGMVELRDHWQPFGNSVYERYDQERTGASKLRRSVQATLQDLLIESGVSPDSVP